MARWLLGLSWLVIFFIAYAGICTAEESPEGAGLRQVGETRLFVEILGEGDPIVFVHGGPGFDHSYFLPHVKPLADDYQLIFYDQRVSGRSPVDLPPEEISLGECGHFSFVECPDATLAVIREFLAGVERRNDASAPAETTRQSLEAAELAFAASAAARDRERFRSFLDVDVVFAGGERPLRGPDAVLAGWDAFFRRGGPSIEWRPQAAEVTRDGLLGMTWGPYSIRVQAADGSVREEKGTYFSTWRRDTVDDDWKIVLDTGAPMPQCPQR